MIDEYYKIYLEGYSFLSYYKFININKNERERRENRIKAIIILIIEKLIKIISFLALS